MLYQVFATCFKAAEFAMQIQQELLRQWVNQWSMATTIAIGNGWTEPVQTMRKCRLENNSEVMNKHREAPEAQHESRVRANRDERRVTEAAIILRRHESVDVHTAAAPSATPAPSACPPQRPRPPGPARARGSGSTRRSLHAHTQFVETGEVRVRKEVVTEYRTIEVPVQREEVVIERYAPTGEPDSMPDLGPGEVIRIPVRVEQIIVEKRPVVKEEVTVGKRVVRDLEQVGGQVRKEKGARRARWGRGHP